MRTHEWMGVWEWDQLSSVCLGIRLGWSMDLLTAWHRRKDGLIAEVHEQIPQESKMNECTRAKFIGGLTSKPKQLLVIVLSFHCTNVGGSELVHMSFAITEKQ